MKNSMVLSGLALAVSMLGNTPSAATEQEQKNDRTRAMQAAIAVSPVQAELARALAFDREIELDAPRPNQVASLADVLGMKCSFSSKNPFSLRRAECRRV